MSDIEIDFEEPPAIARKSEHLSLLLALKDHAGKSARIKKNEALDEKAAVQLAGVVKRAAAKIGNGYEVVSRFIPAANHYGVWVTYSPAEGNEPFVPPAPITEAEAIDQAKALVAEANRPIPVTSTEVDDDIDPIGEDSPDDADWELPERTGARA